MRVGNDLVRNAAILFAELVDHVGKRVHVGVIMAAGRDWVEVSVPELLNLESTQEIHFLPTLLSHTVTIGWRKLDRVGLAYVSGGPPDDRFAGLPRLNDSRSAEEMRSYTPTWRGI
jgi:hypothetical protein